MKEDVKKEIVSRLSKYGLTLEDFSRREIREMAEEVELEMAHEGGERTDEDILDGWFSSPELLGRAFEKEMRQNPDKAR